MAMRTWDEVLDRYREVLTKLSGKSYIQRTILTHASEMLELIPTIRDFPSFEGLTPYLSHYILCFQMPNDRYSLDILYEGNDQFYVGVIGYDFEEDFKAVDERTIEREKLLETIDELVDLYR